MKKQNLIYATLFSFTLLPMATSCSEEDTQDLFPEEYSEILYIKESGEQNVTLYDAGVDVNYSFMVCKGGSDPSQEADVSIQVMSQGEVDAAYTANEGVPYRIIPAESYSLDATELAFTSSDEYKQVNITLNPGTIKNAMEAAETETRWLLPLKAVSENDSVNANKNSYILLIEDVVTPPVGFSTSGVKVYSYSPESGQPLTITNSFKLLTESISNEWDISVDISVDEDYLADYNEANGTGYQLPAEYTLPEGQVTLSAGQQEVPLTFTISKFSDEDAGSFMLPIRLSNPSRFEVPEESAIFAIIVSFGTVQLSPDNWTLTACSENLTGTTSASGYRPVTNLIDGDWATLWDPSWGETTFPHWVKIDMNATHEVSQVGIVRSSNWNQRDVKNVKVYYSNTNNDSDWILAGEFLCEWGEWSEPQKELKFDRTTSFRARYVKLEFLDSYRNGFGFAELYLYGAE